MQPHNSVSYSTDHIPPSLGHQQLENALLERYHWLEDVTQLWRCYSVKNAYPNIRDCGEHFPSLKEMLKESQCSNKHWGAGGWV